MLLELLATTCIMRCLFPFIRLHVRDFYICFRYYVDRRRSGCIRAGQGTMGQKGGGDCEQNGYY